MNIFIVGDVHGALDSIDLAGERMASSNLVLIAGDITHSGATEEAAVVLAAFERHNTSLLAVHGNWDSPDVCTLLSEKGYGLHASGRIMGDTGFFGLGGSSPTPMHTRCEYDEEEITGYLEEGYSRVQNAKRIILLSHVPPRGVRDRTFLGLRGGSTSVRNFLLSHRVHLCVCGHIHEAGGVESFGSSTVANPGSFKRGKYLTAEFNGGLTLSAGRVKKGWFR